MTRHYSNNPEIQSDCMKLEEGASYDGEDIFIDGPQYDATEVFQFVEGTRNIQEGVESAMYRCNDPEKVEKWCKAYNKKLKLYEQKPRYVEASVLCTNAIVSDTRPSTPEQVVHIVKYDGKSTSISVDACMSLATGRAPATIAEEVFLGTARRRCRNWPDASCCTQGSVLWSGITVVISRPHVTENATVYLGEGSSMSKRALWPGNQCGVWASVSKRQVYQHDQTWSAVGDGVYTVCSLGCIVRNSDGTWGTRDDNELANLGSTIAQALDAAMITNQSPSAIVGYVRPNGGMAYLVVDVESSVYTTRYSGAGMQAALRSIIGRFMRGDRVTRGYFDIETTGGSVLALGGIVIASNHD
ncbi:hypothetical protein HDV06_000816, partial [Boothiomyces sp. JEL0866]